MTLKIIKTVSTARAKKKPDSERLPLSKPTFPKSPALPPLIKDDSPVKLPRAIEADERCERIEEALMSDLRTLWEDGSVPVPHIPFSKKLEKALIALNKFHQLERGLENIEKILVSEKKGLEAIRRKEGKAMTRRISRVLFITEDGTERFYRSCESLMHHHSDRLLCIRLGANSEQFSEKLFGPEKKVKAVLITERDAVTQVLFSILDEAKRTPANAE